MSTPRDDRPCPCRCATRRICPVPDDGARCPCNPYRMGRGHKGSDELLEAAQKRCARPAGHGPRRIAGTPLRVRPANPHEIAETDGPSETEIR